MKAMRIHLHNRERISIDCGCSESALMDRLAAGNSLLAESDEASWCILLVGASWFCEEKNWNRMMKHRVDLMSSLDESPRRRASIAHWSPKNAHQTVKQTSQVNARKTFYYQSKANMVNGWISIVRLTWLFTGESSAKIVAAEDFFYK